jgi:integrase/recombinase XerD
MALGASHQFEVTGLKREHWRTATPIRGIFKQAFTLAGLPYFNPHSFRNTLVALAETRCKSPEEFKAWSQNLGHEGVLTTFSSYGAVAIRRQAEIIAHLGMPAPAPPPDAAEFARAVARELLASHSH